MRRRIVVDGTALCVANEAPPLGPLAYVCSVCCHKPEYDDAETCPKHPNAPLVPERTPMADMLRAIKVEVMAGSGKPSHIAANQGVPVGVARKTEPIPIAVHEGAPVGIAQPTEDAPVAVGVTRQTATARIAARPFQTYLPFLGSMPRTAQLCERNEWAECRLRNKLPVTADMDPTTIPGRT